MRLYELQDDITELEGLLDEWAQDNAGDITDFPYDKQYENLKGMREQKLLNLATWYKSVKAEAEAYKQECQSLQTKKKVCENKMKYIKSFIEEFIKDGEKIKDSRCALSWRKSEAIEIDADKMDLRKWPDSVKKIVITPDKTAMKNAIKLGEILDSVKLVKKNNLQIK